MMFRFVLLFLFCVYSGFLFGRDYNSGQSPSRDRYVDRLVEGHAWRIGCEGRRKDTFKAVKIFAELSQQDENTIVRDKARFFLGFIMCTSQGILRNYEQAAIFFKSVEQSQDCSVRITAWFNLGLLHLGKCCPDASSEKALQYFTDVESQHPNEQAVATAREGIMRARRALEREARA